MTHTADPEALPELPPYIYGREAAPNEKVWTEAAINALRRRCMEAGIRKGLERAAVICLSLEFTHHQMVTRDIAEDCAAAIRAAIDDKEQG